MIYSSHTCLQSCWRSLNFKTETIKCQSFDDQVRKSTYAWRLMHHIKLLVVSVDVGTCHFSGGYMFSTINDEAVLILDNSPKLRLSLLLYDKAHPLLISHSMTWSRAKCTVQHSFLAVLGLHIKLLARGLHLDILASHNNSLQKLPKLLFSGEDSFKMCTQIK